MIFSLVVIGVAISVITMYVRHGRFMRRKRLAESAGGHLPPPKHDDPQ